MIKNETILYWRKADGKTHKEALSNVEIIAKEWIETAQELGLHLNSEFVSL
jgi:predicted RNase H-like HicB family nuclease